jgi:hypothetical protein
MLTAPRPRLVAVLAALRSPRTFPLAAALVALLSLPALPAGHFLDDTMHLARLELGPRSLRGASELYCFTSCPGGSAETFLRGPIPWWNDPLARVDLFRPLASLLFAAEHALFPRQALVPHLLSLLWFVALLGVARALYARLPDRAGAGLALLLFAVDDAHWQPIGWLANRHGLVATVPVLLGLVAHLRWREEGLRAGLPLSLLGYVVGLLGGEAALQAAAYLVAYEVTRAGRWSERARALAPAAAVFGAYLGAYRALGYGARGHEQYVDPTGEPGRFAVALVTRVPTLLADLLAGLPVDLWATVPALHAAFVVVGLAALIAVAALLRAALRGRPPEEVRRVAWFALGGLGSLLPGAAALPGSRLLLMPSLGAAVVIATVLAHVASRARPPAALRVGAALLAVVHVVVAPVALVATLARVAGMARAVERIARDAEIDPAPDPGAVDVVVLDAPDLVTMLYPPLVRRLDPATRERSWWTLSLSPLGHRLTRTGPTTLRLATVGGDFFTSEWEKVFRPARRALGPGEDVELPGLSVRVVSRSEIELDLHRPLEDPSLRFVTYREGGLRRVRLPPPGGEVFLPAVRGLLAP